MCTSKFLAMMQNIYFLHFVLATVKKNILWLWARDERYTDPYKR